MIAYHYVHTQHIREHTRCKNSGRCCPPLSAFAPASHPFATAKHVNTNNIDIRWIPPQTTSKLKISISLTQIKIALQTAVAVNWRSRIVVLQLSTTCTWHIRVRGSVGRFSHAERGQRLPVTQGNRTSALVNRCYRTIIVTTQPGFSTNGVSTTGDT